MCSDSVHVATPQAAGGHSTVEVALPWGQTAQMRLHKSDLPRGDPRAASASQQELSARQHPHSPRNGASHFSESLPWGSSPLP